MKDLKSFESKTRLEAWGYGDTLVSFKEPSFCLTVDGEVTSEPGILVTSCRATANQRWQRDESGLWHTDLNPSYCLGTTNPVPNYKLSVLPCDDEGALHFVKDENDPIYLVEGTNDALTFSFEDGGDGPALLYRKHGDSQQHWYWTEEDIAFLEENADKEIVYPFSSDDTLAWEMEYAKDRVARRQPPAEPIFTFDPSIYPGVVGADVERVTRQFTFNHAFKDHSYLRMFVPPENWMSTGLYAPAGEILKVTVDDAILSDLTDMYLIIGPHIDTLDLNNNDVNVRGEVLRYPNISLIVRLLPGKNLVRSPYGGLIFLSSVQDLEETIEVEIEGAVESPHFVLGETTEAEWLNARQNGVPWGEIEADRAIIMSPIEDLEKLTFEEATELALFYDKVVEYHNELSGLSDDGPFPHESPQGKQRFLTDKQIIDLGAHNGFPLMFSHNLADPSLFTGYTNTGLGVWHELGHNYQQPFWDDVYDSEATTDIFALYDEEQLFGTSLLVDNGIYDNVFLLLDDASVTQKWEEAGIFERLVFIMQIKHHFGWEPLQMLRQRYRELSEEEVDEVNRDDQAKRDTFFLLLCETTGYNLTEHFETWAIELSAEAKADPACQDKPEPEVNISSLRADVHDLTLRLTAVDEESTVIAPGEDLLLNIEILNQGNLPVRSVALVDNLAPGFDLSPDDSNGWANTGYRYVRLVAETTSNSDNQMASAAEIGVLDKDGNPLSKANWKIIGFDSQDFWSERTAAKAIDDDPDTSWSTDSYSTRIDSQHELQIDLGAYYELSAFTYLPPNDESAGVIADYRFFVSLDGADWKEVISGTFEPDTSEKQVDLTLPSLNNMAVNVVETPLAPGESIKIELLLTTDSTLPEDYYQNMAEITAVYDNVGSLGLDLDSTDNHDLIDIYLNQNSKTGPSGYIFCANENEYCAFSGTKDVAYGAAGYFNYQYNVSEGLDCNNSVFGDPIENVVKACYVSRALGLKQEKIYLPYVAILNEQ